MMSIDEAIDQIEDLMTDVWYGASEGKAIYVSEDDYNALAVAKEALEEKMGG